MKKLINIIKTFFAPLIWLVNSALAMSFLCFGIAAFAFKDYSKLPDDNHANAAILSSFLCFHSVLRFTFEEIQRAKEHLLLKTEILIRKIKNETL